MSEFLRRSCINVSPLLFFLLFLQGAYGQPDFTDLEKKLQQYQSQLGGSVVTLVYRDGKLIYNKSSGQFTPETQVPIASCSKWMTAALVMTFVDEGLLSLDDTIGKFMPVFSANGKGSITLKQCLSHETGIQGDKPIRGLMKIARFRSLEEEVDAYARQYKIEAPPGTEFWYGNIGLNIAGRIVEIIGHEPFETLMQERICRPLKMSNTTFLSTRAVNPSGGARSTAKDYMNFLIMILHKGTFNGKMILTERSIEEMQSAQTEFAKVRYTPAVATGCQYGLGEWILETGQNGKSTCVASPGLFGTWPLVDTKREYACIFLVKNLLREDRKNIYTDLKKTIDKDLDMP